MKYDEPKLVINDSQVLPEVGSWSKIKHRKVAYYCSLFATSMKMKWDCRVYIDLFSGAGKCKIRDTDEIIIGSPLHALNVDDPFDEYVFCETDLEYMAALKKRVNLYFSDRKCSFVSGDINNNVRTLLDILPVFSREYKGLSLCFVDPYKKGELEFSTLSKISNALYVDFLVLIPTYMDINRNELNYTQPGNNSLDSYLGTPSWREVWSTRTHHNRSFGSFIADQFGQQMSNLGFIYEGLNDMELVRMNTDHNIPLYHLAFFSKNSIGLRFWRETIKNTNSQFHLPF